MDAYRRAWMVDLLVDNSIQRRRFSYRSVTLAMARFSRWQGCKSAILGLLCIHDSIYAVVESTLFHINNDYSWTPFLVIGVLTLASIGNILYGLLAYSAYQDGLDGSNMMMLGSVMLSIQCIILDGIVWNVKFPW